jgi:hypothetical protein
MRCRNCSALPDAKTFNGEVAIHFPGLDGLNRPVVWTFPKMLVCLQCGFVEFILPDEVVEELRTPDAPTQSRESGYA